MSGYNDFLGTYNSSNAIDYTPYENEYNNPKKQQYKYTKNNRPLTDEERLARRKHLNRQQKEINAREIEKIKNGNEATRRRIREREENNHSQRQREEQSQRQREQKDRERRQREEVRRRNERQRVDVQNPSIDRQRAKNQERIQRNNEINSQNNRMAKNNKAKNYDITRSSNSNAIALPKRENKFSIPFEEIIGTKSLEGKKFMMVYDKTQKAKIPLNALAMLLYIFVILMGSIFMTNFSHSKVVQVQTLKSEYRELETDRDALIAQLTNETNLEKVRTQAMDELGMNTPTKNQIVYITTPKANYVEFNNENTKNDKWSSSIKNIFGKYE